jgi:hypothetical protein
MPPTNFLGDYARQRRRAVIVDAGALTTALARQRAPDGNTRAATVECADLARAFVFNDISMTLTNNAMNRISTLLSISSSFAWRREEFPHVLLPLPHRADGPVVDVDRHSDLPIGLRRTGVCAATVECATYGFGSALIVSEYIILYSISTSIATSILSLKSIKRLILHTLRSNTKSIGASPRLKVPFINAGMAFIATAPLPPR